MFAVDKGRSTLHVDLICLRRVLDILCVTKRKRLCLDERQHEVLFAQSEPVDGKYEVDPLSPTRRLPLIHLIRSSFFLFAHKDEFILVKRIIAKNS